MVKAFQEFFRGMKMNENTPDEVINVTTPIEGEKRVKGKIFKLSPQGYGFISSHDIPFTRIFFHWSSLRANTKKFTDLKVGDLVEFTPSDTKDKGTRAIRISVYDIGVDDGANV